MELAPRMATSPLSPAQLGNPAAAAGKTKELGTFAVRLVVLYVFLLSSRSFEVLTQITGRNLFIMMVLSAIGLFLVFAKGTFTRITKSPAGLLLLAFTGWAMLILPFSSWKSASLSELANTWSKSLAAFVIIVGLTPNLAVVRKIYAALGFGAVAATLLMVKFGWYDGGRLSGFGSLMNSNEVAFHLIVGIPFLLLLISRSKLIWKIGYGVVVLLALQLSMRTASRSGLIMLGVVFIVSFLRVSMAMKAKMVIIGVIAVIVAIGSVSQDQMDRYSTLFSSEDDSPAAQSARLSEQERRKKMDEAVELTLMHPIFGVGMGAYIPSSTALEDSKGEKEVWIMPHDSYVQVSSETGFLGAILFTSVLLYCFRELFKLNKAAKRLKLTEIRDLSLAMLLALCVMSLHFTFDAIAYEFYLPMMAGLATILIVHAKPVVAEAEARAAGKPLPAGFSADPDLSGELVLATSELPARTPKMLSGPLEAGRPPVPRSQNPFRFGRRRTSS